MRIIKKALYNTVYFAHELVLGWAWIAFGVLSATITQVLDTQYPVIQDLFHIGFVTTGVFMLIAVAFSKLMLPAYVFSAFVASATLIASLGTDSSLLYHVTWALIAFLSITQAIRFYLRGEEVGN